MECMLIKENFKNVNFTGNKMQLYISLNLLHIRYHGSYCEIHHNTVFCNVNTDCNCSDVETLIVTSTVLCSLRSGDPQLIGEAYATLKEICKLVSLCIYTIMNLSKWKILLVTK